jgi:predicted SAM-dependent methyltransferase
MADRPQNGQYSQTGTLKQRVGRWIAPKLPFGPRTLGILRYEINAAIATTLSYASPKLYYERNKLAGQTHLNVNLGSGGKGIAGWINVDISRSQKDVTFPWDIRRRLPFRDAQVARVFAEHVIEHLEFRNDIPFLLSELFRVLEIGGRVRIVVPDAERWLRAYVTQDPAEWRALGFGLLPDDMPTPMTMINHVFHQEGEHCFGYDFETLKFVLAGAGFRKIQKSGFQGSQDPEFGFDRPEHAAYSLYVEAEKIPGPT